MDFNGSSFVSISGRELKLYRYGRIYMLKGEVYPTTTINPGEVGLCNITATYFSSAVRIYGTITQWSANNMGVVVALPNSPKYNLRTSMGAVLNTTDNCVVEMMWFA
jgi:hypothetical protein